MDKSRFFPTDSDFPAPLNDLEQLRAWARTIDAFLADGKGVTRLSTWVFRPHSQALDAMVVLDSRFSEGIRQIRESLDFTEKQYTEFSDEAFNQETAAADNLAGAMFDLMRRINSVADLIERQQGNNVESEITAGSIRQTGGKDELPSDTHKAAAGRRPTTRPLAKFADTRRNRKSPMTWKEIAIEYLMLHPDAVDANGNQITGQQVRGAWRRHYQKKSP
jgi:hypothetical protein